MSRGRGAGQATLSVTELYHRFRQLIHESAKFGIVGLVGVVVVLAGSYALHFDLGLGKFTSVTIATIFATAITFLGNRYWSFRYRQGAGARSETVLFFFLNGVGLLIQYACLFLLSDLLGLSGKIWYTIANFVGIGFGTLFRFWSYRKWIWVRPEVHLARLRRGRHRKGRTTPVPPAPAQAPAHQPMSPREAMYAGQPAGFMPRPPMPQPLMPQPLMPQQVMPQQVMPQVPPLAKRQVRQAGQRGGPHPLGQPMLAATHTPVPTPVHTPVPTPAPTADEPDRWI